MKPRIPTPAINALIGDEEQTGKREKEERTKKETGSRREEGKGVVHVKIVYESRKESKKKPFQKNLENSPN